ncbi:DUF2975 domain-containing protein [Desulforamulus aquiferis]|uniref:DUF2975 domain-containing protein n=1 Tax=Desulforamulus aquiferis TaxID=1397668 RepID=A0AAW7ZEI4_9FIRM|nr:DUF2975 domain-containing protein [Desulforamulus aquiferis]MDO7788164.1 DUF2975 domain-containing protein [Desulforamulus aquiferis]RYD02596.1 hypothetical protein N752_25030 [Desulforamulus aquiferis]
MKRETFFLKVAVILIGIPIFGLCLFGLPSFVNYLNFPVLVAMYAAAVPYFFALYQTLKLLSYIDKNRAFSESSVNALNYIKYCAITISILYAGITPLLFPIAQSDDAPGILVIGLVITFASIVIAVFAAVLQKLLKNAIDIKSENDLTI